MHLEADLCPVVLCDDLTYWGLDQVCLQPCCATRYHATKDGVEVVMERAATHLFTADEERWRPGRLGELQAALWNTMERPTSSTAARIVSVISITFVVSTRLHSNLKYLHHLMAGGEHGWNDALHPLLVAVGGQPGT